MATADNQARWRDRKRKGESAPKCLCGKRLREESRSNLCRSCWLKTPEGRAYNQHRVARQQQSTLAPMAKQIAFQLSKELGFINIRALEESEARKELEVVLGVGFAHFHCRRDKQTTIYSLAVLPEYQRQGWGRLLFYRVLCSSIEKKCDRIFLKCPEENLAANEFYHKLGFKLIGTDSGKKRKLNCWEYRIDLPLLFFCNGGGTSRYDAIAEAEGWRLGIQSTDRNGKPRCNKPGWHMEMIDNEWGGGYRHNHHVSLIQQNKPLVATVRDITSIEQLPEAVRHAREIAPYCGRVILIPKIKSWLPSEFWLGFSVPSSHGFTPVEPSWFGDRFVHLLGGSPDAQAQYAKLMNVVSLDSKYAMSENLAGKGKSAWQGCSNGVKVVSGCYESFRVSLERQRQYWWVTRHQPWADDPLFRVEF